MNWTADMVREIAARYTVLKVFRIEQMRAYNAALALGIKDEVCAHMRRRKYWTHDLVRAEAAKYPNITQFGHKSNGAYQYAERYGLLPELFPTYKGTKRG